MNEQNLIPPSVRTKSERKKIAQMGGKASGIKRRENARLRKMIVQALEIVENETNLTLKEKAVLNMVKKAAEGDIKAFAMIMQLAGEWNIRETDTYLWGD